MSLLLQDARKLTTMGILRHWGDVVFVTTPQYTTPPTHAQTILNAASARMLRVSFGVM